MRLNEFDDSLSRADLDNLEVFADKVFGKVGIDVNFTRHFLDRVNDERNIKQITKGELTRLFKQEAKRWAKPIARLGPDAEGTMKDLQTQINLPFVLVWDHNNQELDLIAKTVMRKKDFKTHNTEFPVESTVREAGRYNPDGETYRGTQNKMPILQPDPVDDAEDYDELDHDYEGSQMDDYAQAQLKKQLSDVVSGLTKKEQLVVSLRFGLNGTEPKTLEEIGKIYRVSKGRIRQIEAKALRKLRHPDRTDHLRPHLEESKLNEGGAMPGVGAIHVDEIASTLQSLEKVLGIDLMNNVLGSVGKKQFSGDIDVALNIPAADIPTFVEKLKTIPEIIEVTKSSVIMTKVKIQNYDDSKEIEGKDRTGFVQVDFMPGDPDWMKVYYHSPHEKGMDAEGDRSSKYKGMHRNIMIASIAGVYNRENSGNELPDGRYEKTEMYMLSPRDGLVRVTRTPVPRKDGNGFTAKNKNTIIGGPWLSNEAIADVLNLGNADSLYSLETLVDAVSNNYADDVKNTIFTNFANNAQVGAVGIPDELKDYVK